MDISKLLNPQQQQQQPLKRYRRGHDTNSVPFNPESWLPVEIIGYIIQFVDRPFRRELRLVSRAWYTAYMSYHRCSCLMYGYDKSIKWTRSGTLDALRKNGRRLREMLVKTSFFKELVEIEPNLGDLIPNLVTRQVLNGLVKLYRR
ncbi:hypothetical protein GQ42DRAFT_158633 [Ramicandelaber brevisporus]|nr:hypothetical protein GQ42DRAFT_158633 [Ramicandelaber brevisporus]